MARSVLSVLAACLCLLAAQPVAQSEMVIVKEGTRQYHRPACPVVRDGRGVILMSRAQAEARGFKPHPDCDPAKAPPADPAAQPSAPAARPAPPVAPVFVYVAAGDSRYHRETCRNLPAHRQKVTLDEAAKKHWPCAVCRPPIRKRTNPPAIPPRYGRG